MVGGVVGWIRSLPGKVADAVVVPLLAVGALALLALLAVFVLDDHVPVWVVILALGIGVITGALWVDRSNEATPAEELDTSELDELRRMAAELEPYPTYANHLRDALDLLRKVGTGELPSFSLRDFVEVGVFQPANVLLTKSGKRGDVRFSILHVEDGAFYMAKDGGLSPAFGHRAQSREVFRLAVVGSFSQLAYERNKVFWSGRLSDDDRFEKHEHAEDGREYESLVSVPLVSQGDDPDGVLNAIATNADAFSEVDRTYITLLGSVIDVGRIISMQWEDDEGHQVVEEEARVDDDAV